MTLWSEQTLIGKGYLHLIPEDLKRPTTPPWLKNPRKAKKEVAGMPAGE